MPNENFAMFLKIYWKFLENLGQDSEKLRYMHLKRARGGNPEAVELLKMAKNL